MRIKEEIKRVGEFWLPASPKNKISGTLLISDGGNTKLELAEPLDSSLSAMFSFNSDNLGRILGHVETDGPVTLDNCYYINNRRSIVRGGLIASDIIGVNRVFTGFRYEKGVSPRFNEFTFSVEGIDEWVGISGIEVDAQFEKSALTISYNRPEDISLDLKDGMQLVITFAWTPPGFPNAQRAEVTQKTYFKLVSQGARELEEFTSVAQKITAFLCFVMNEIVCLDEMTAFSDNLRETFPDGRTALIPVEVYCSSWPYAKNEPAIDERNMLFKYKDIQTRVEGLINKWIENYEQIAPALDLYFLAKTGTLPTLNMQFLALAQALEAFHRNTSAEMHMDENEFKEIRKNIINRIPKKDRNWFCSKLDFANELTLKNRIEKLIEPFDCFIDNERKPRLINSIKDTRNYLTHPDSDSDLESKAAKGKDLILLCLKMNALFRLQFLKLIGFDEQEIDDIVDECARLKGECNL